MCYYQNNDSSGGGGGDWLVGWLTVVKVGHGIIGVVGGPHR